MIFMIDNYDSFTYNIVQYFYMLGADVTEGEKTISHLPISFGGKAVYRVTALTENGLDFLIQHHGIVPALHLLPPYGVRQPSLPPRD